MNQSFIYEVRGAIVNGGGAMEKVELCREVKAGDIFFANSAWFQVERAGLHSLCGGNEDHPGRLLMAKKLERGTEP